MISLVAHIMATAEKMVVRAGWLDRALVTYATVRPSHFKLKGRALEARLVEL